MKLYFVIVANRPYFVVMGLYFIFVTLWLNLTLIYMFILNFI